MTSTAYTFGGIVLSGAVMAYLYLRVRCTHKDIGVMVADANDSHNEMCECCGELPDPEDSYSIWYAWMAIETDEIGL